MRHSGLFHSTPTEHSRPDPRRGSDAERAFRILKTVVGDYQGPAGIRLWDGCRVYGGPEVPGSLVFRDAAFLRQLVLHWSALTLGEGYLAGRVDAEGAMEPLFHLIEHLRQRRLAPGARARLAWEALHLPRTRAARGPGLRGARAHENSPATIAHHYDVGNDFYRLWLDREMVYSCAYFRDPAQSLEAAQRDKLDYICRKLRLAPGMDLLDIGCGWGALVCWAARHYGVRAHGITLSRQQYAYARERVRREGLEDRVRIELRDYRDLPPAPAYDRVVSVGMFEHVGVANFPTYFGTVRRVLRPGGLFLNHGITNDTGWTQTDIQQFVNRYVFPDGELAPVSEVQDAMEKAGFEIHDVEGLRRHYALTLRHWVRRLEAHREQALQQVPEPVYRLWRLYMAGSAYYFDEGSVGVYQILAGHQLDRPPLPLRRDDLYH